MLLTNIPEEKPLCYTLGWRLYIDEKDGLSKFFPEYYDNAEHGYSIDFEYERIPQKILDIYLPFFKRLKPSAEITEE